MWIKPSTLIASVVSVGALALGLVFFFWAQFSPRHRWLILAGSLAGWYVLSVWVILPVAVIAQSVRNKRHGVFSHLRKSSTRELETVPR